MINYTALHGVFGDTLPEAHLFFANRKNKYATSYASLRKDLGMTRARTNRKVWLTFVDKYKEQTSGEQEVPVTSVTLTPDTATIAKGATLQLTPNVLPANATNKTLTYVSSNIAATVSASGLITVIPDASSGTVIRITAVPVDGSGEGECMVTVGAA